MLKDCPEYITVDLIVTVNQAIPETDDFRPCNLRMFIARQLRDTPRGLANDFQQTRHRQMKQSVIIQISSTSAGG